MYQVLARKWRPKNFQELVGQQHVTQALCYALSHKHIHHAYLFTGTRGVGKTTIARIFAKSINCLHNGISAEPCGQCRHCQEIDAGCFPDLIEVDAASRTQVEYTRQLLSNVPYAPIKGRFKVYLIDEVHMFSDSSFNSLLKTLEEPPAHVKFILATTDPQKIPQTVLSRCLQFQLKNMTTVQISSHLQTVLNAESCQYEDEALNLLAEAAQGSMRDSLSLLDQAVAFGQGNIRTQDVASLLGAVPAVKVRALFKRLADGDARSLREQFHEFETFSPDYSDLLRRILQGLQKITIAQLNAQRHSCEVHQDFIELAQRIPVELIQLWYQIATDTWQSLPYQPNSAAAIEMMLLRMLALQPIFPEQSLEKVKPIAEARIKLDNPSSLEEIATEFSNAEAHQIQHHPLSNQHIENVGNPQTTIAEPPPFATEPPPYMPEDLPPFHVEKNIIAPEISTLQESGITKVPPLETISELATEKQNNALSLSIATLKNAVGNPPAWAKIVEKLSANNIDKLVAENLYPYRFDDNINLYLEGDGAGALWATPENLNYLAELLSQTLQQAIKVHIHLGQAQQKTVFEARKTAQDAEQARAKNDFYNHPSVQQLTQTLGAEIQENSIQSTKR